MAHETRIGMLVGMGFIICFAIILSNRGGLDRVAPQMPYQLFGAPAAPAPPASRHAGSAAQDTARSLQNNANPPGAEREAVIPPPLQAGAPDQAAPGEKRPPRPRSAGDAERLIQRRRSLLPTRELAERGAPSPEDNISQDATLPDDALAEAGESDEWDPESPEPSGEDDPPLTLAGNLQEEGDETGSEESAPTDRTDLPAALAGYADQLEVVTADRTPPAANSAAPIQPAASDRNDSSEAVPATFSYLVAKGDTLSHIAKRHYGSAGKNVLSAIMAANRGTVRSPKSLMVGQSLSLPVVDGRAPKAEVAQLQETAERLRPATGSERGSKSEPVPETDAEVSSGPRVVLTASQPNASRTQADPGTASEPSWRWYTVKKGDLFSTIAQEQLGTSKRWKELLELNKDVCPDARQLRTGIQIRIPNRVLADAR